MKKIIVRIAIILLAVSLTACSSKGQQTAEENTKTDAQLLNDMLNDQYTWVVPVKTIDLLRSCNYDYDKNGKPLDIEWNGVSSYDNTYIHTCGIVKETTNTSLLIDYASYLRGKELSLQATVTPVIAESVGKFNPGDVIWFVGKFNSGGLDRRFTFNDALVFTNDEYFDAFGSAYTYESYESCVDLELEEVDASELLYNDEFEFPKDETRVVIKGLYLGALLYDSGSLWFDPDTSFMNTIFGTNRGLVVNYVENYLNQYHEGDRVIVTGILHNGTYELSLDYAQIIGRY